MSDSVGASVESNNNNVKDKKTKQSKSKGKGQKKNDTAVLPKRGRPPKISENILALFEEDDEVPGLGPKPRQKGHEKEASTENAAGSKKRLKVVPQKDSDNQEVSLNCGNVKCDLCGRSFSNTSGYKRHLKPCQEASGPALVVKMQKIPLNEVTSEDEETLSSADDNSASDGEASRANPKNCPCCDEPLETCHKGDEQCPKCEKKFPSSAVVDRHIQLAHSQSKSSSQSKTFQCGNCKRKFSRKYHLDRHVAQTGCDGRPKTSFPCEVCGKEFSRKDNLREHLRGHAGQVKRKRKFACEFCGKEFGGLSMLQIHVRRHNGERPFNCTYCDKSFVSNNALQKHTRTHTGERPYECTECKARFAAKETLNRHMRTHTESKPHVCSFCGKGFIQPTQLKAHLFHHTGENGYTCGECGRCFNRKNRLELHMKFVHQGADPFPCDKCDKTFIRKGDLSRHLLLHEGVKPHKCNLCDKSFSIKSALKVHLLTHTREPPTSCEECGRAFIRQDCLLRHMRIKHRDTLEKIMADGEKKKIHQQLQASKTANGSEKEEGDELSKRPLAENISELLSLLVDESTLRAFGWPEKPVNEILEAVIKRCGHEPISSPSDDALNVRNLLENQSVDEVVWHVLRLARA